jgi:hypothetical protein
MRCATACSRGTVHVGVLADGRYGVHNRPIDLKV